MGKRTATRVPLFWPWSTQKDNAPTATVQWWQLTEEKTPHREPLCEELRPNAIYFFVSLLTLGSYRCRWWFVSLPLTSLFLCRKLHLFLGKSTKTAATRDAFLTLICSYMHHIVCRLGLRPHPTGEAYSAPKSHSCIYGLTSKGSERKRSSSFTIERKSKVGA